MMAFRRRRRGAAVRAAAADGERRPMRESRS
jgi:hypothetical protein